METQLIYLLGIPQYGGFLFETLRGRIWTFSRYEDSFRKEMCDMYVALRERIMYEDRNEI